MVHTREQAARNAEASKSNVPGTCQLWTRTQFGAPSAGDQDRDGDADAVDGWKSEPVSARHADRLAPRGVPVAFSGGSKGFGHRAISLGNGKIRSTDMSDDGTRYQAGNVGTTTIANLEHAMNIKYLGWSDTITGLTIPSPPPAPKPAPKPKLDLSRDGRIRLLRRAIARANKAGRKRQAAALTAWLHRIEASAAKKR